ncbi:hypothetical protein LNTAR_18393 [Lentisphaera araneosa HTCC2155]|uniref:Uncharacterized protein n=1 Tax=Lentisphaera araneosa HTCC2155 TaxID=313628 RepID=A6DG17_9BACT|nr:hypothetical protein [Lentisphaera araneosa]EDM29747.1 hypothetical protein LNTAR_18393 [Lentisphaera araneosa HTCC2155]
MAVKIFKVKHDFTSYSLLPEKNNTFFNLKIGKGESLSEQWNPDWRFYVRNVIDRDKGSFYYISPSILTFDKILLKGGLEVVLRNHGEFLESILEDTESEIIIYNPLKMYDCLDFDNTTFETDEVGGDITNIAVDIHAFDLEKIGDSSIFKLPGRYVHPTYVVTGLHDEEKDFYLQYKKLDLTGLDFELVWSNE